MEELVSIIVPVYNCETYIMRCINSIIEQSYKNIELLIIDDGSIDNTRNVCLNAINIISNGKYYYQDNRGVSSARNLGIEKANGKYITFIDADDYVDSDFIKEMVSSIEREEADMVISNAYDVDENGNIKECRACAKNILLDKRQAVECFLKSKFFYAVCWGRLYKSELIKNIKFDINMRIAEDGKFFLEALEKCNKVLVISDKHYYYFIHSASTVHAGFTPKFYDEVHFCKELCDKYSFEPHLQELAYQKLYFFLERLLSISNIDKAEFLKVRYEYIMTYHKVHMEIPLWKKVRFYFLRNYMLRNCYLVFRNIVKNNWIYQKFMNR